MLIDVAKHVLEPDNIRQNCSIEIISDQIKSNHSTIDSTDCIAYPPFINSHDHLIGNWYPRNGENRPYPNTDIWVHEMKFAPTYLERNKVWVNDGSFSLMEGTAPLLVSLGIYKNICSGCGLVQDHASLQKKEYYEQFPIRVLKEYRQCHSISIGNWWGDKSPEEEMAETKGKMPFILHLAEGTDERAYKDFTELKKRNLLKANTLMIHGIALTKKEIEECAEIGASVCWCPESNEFLIGRSIDVPFCLEKGMKVVLGTDSTQSGSLNLIAEIKKGHEMFPHIPMKEIYKMISTTPQKTLFLDGHYGRSKEQTQDILLIKKKSEDPFNNLLEIDFHDIEFFLYHGKPIYGDTKFLSYFEYDPQDYYFFNEGKCFVIGHPENTLTEIDNYLHYHKDFPFLPFS